MATIKKTGSGDNLRIITKVGDDEIRRVSCSCCDEDCCMYPANFLGDLFDIEDLPDVLQDNSERTYEKVESTYTIELAEESYKIYYEGPILDGFENLDPPDPELIYFIAIPSYDQNQWYIGSIFDGDVGPCLISEIDGNIGGMALDTFEESYTITTNQSSGVVNRSSLCLWTGEDEFGCSLSLRYRTKDPSRFKWTVSYSKGSENSDDPCDEITIAIKEQNQNTPAGDYDGDITVD